MVVMATNDGNVIDLNPQQYGCSINSLRYKIYCSKQGNLKVKAFHPNLTV